MSFKRTILDFRIEALPGESLGGRRVAALHIVGSAFLWHQARALRPCRDFRALRLYLGLTVAGSGVLLRQAWQGLSGASVVRSAG